MDVFDGEPYLGLIPRGLVRALGWAAVLALAFVPQVRQWWIDQAEQHVLHEMQPLINELVKPATAAPEGPTPSP
jgi:hypothetical protein